MRYETVPPGEFEAALGASPRPFVLDVRPREAFEAGHVPGSRNVPVHDLGRRQSELPRTKVAPLLVVGEPGRRSEAAAAWLDLMGWSDVRLLAGGMAAWTGAIETGPETPLPPRWEPALRVVRD